MKLLARAAAHGLFLFGVLVFIVLPGNKYSWMQEMDPATAALPIDDMSGNKAIFAILLLIAIVITQLAIALKTVNRTEKAVSIAFALLAIFIWALR